MSDKDKFEGFKDKIIKENEEKYGQEIRENYGDSSVDYSNTQIKKLSKAEHEKLSKLSIQVNETIKEAHKLGDHKSEKAIEACKLHKEWISFYWPKYTKEAHLGLVEMYIADERFTAYYDKNCGEGSAQFLLEAMKHYLSNN